MPCSRIIDARRSNVSVPVLRFAAPLVHRVEAHVARLRHLEKEPAHDALTLRVHLDVERTIEFLAARFVLRAKLLVDLRGHLAHAQLDDRDVGRHIKVVVELGARQRELRLRQRSKPRRKQMNIRSPLCPSICTAAVDPASGTASARFASSAIR